MSKTGAATHQDKPAEAAPESEKEAAKARITRKLYEQLDKVF
jgi:hypothetical protein